MEKNIRNKCKAYSSLEQSKKLAEILPLESADMRYSPLGDIMHPWVWTDTFIEKDAIPCWSLAALLDVLPSSTLESSNDHYYMLQCMERVSGWHENPIDACYEMITKLHEQKLL